MPEQPLTSLHTNSSAANFFLERIWSDALVLMIQEVGNRIVETWFKSVTLQRWDSTSSNAFIRVPNKFVQDWLLKHYSTATEKCLARVLNSKTIKVYFILEDLKNEQQENVLLTIAPAKLDYEEKIHTKEPSSSSYLPSIKTTTNTMLNPQYTFDTFVVGSSNELAYAASKSVAERKHLLYNPLFIYGSSGLGKTHLLNAIGNHIKQTHPHLTVLYQSADKFMQKFIQAIRSNTASQFELSFKNVDVLLIDDIQSISKKEQTQEVFFKIFNMLYHTRNQIVVSSDCMPRDIKGLADRIKSRFEGGLIVDVHLPPFETMVVIVHRKAELYGISLPAEVAHYIVSRVSTSIREVEGILIRLAAYTTLTKQPLSLETVSHVMLFRENKAQDNIELHQILSLIVMRYRVSLTLLRSNDRNKKITRVRHLAMYLMKKMTHRSFKDIGMYLHRDHSTIMHGYEKMIRERAQDQDLETELKGLEKELAGLQ